MGIFARGGEARDISVQTVTHCLLSFLVIGLNVRHNFHAVTHLYSKYHFSNKRCTPDFHSFLGIFRSGSGTSHGGSALFEPSAQNSIIEADSVEPSAQLPIGLKVRHNGPQPSIFVRTFSPITIIVVNALESEQLLPSNVSTCPRM